MLSRGLRTSWLVAAALAGLLLPGKPYDALGILAGQLIMAVNFVFLRRLVKLFTERTAASRGPFAFALIVKIALVYGGLAAVLAFGRIRYVPFTVGLGLPLVVLFLKSILLAFGQGPSSIFARRANETVRSLRAATKLAALLLPLLFVPGLSFAAEAAKPAEGSAQELPNWIVLLHDFFPQSPVIGWLEKNQIIVFAWLAGLLFLFLSWLAMRKPKLVPGPFQNGVEWVVESMYNVSEGLLGPQIDRHFPLIGALFFYILTINMLGIFPGMKSATSSLDLTLALALITFLYVQFWGIRNLGPIGYLDHLAGSPRDPIGWAMLPVMLPVHILGELAKPVSLSCRLFGNIFGEDTLIVVFVGATAMLLKASLLALAVPPMAGITALFMMLQTLTSIVQALIFSLLATVYLYMMLPHEEHGHEESHAEAHATS